MVFIEWAMNIVNLRNFIFFTPFSALFQKILVVIKI